MPDLSLPKSPFLWKRLNLWGCGVKAARAMFTLFVSLLFSVPAFFRPRLALEAEILALRHPLLVLQRSRRGHKLRFGCADRALWVWLSRLWTAWPSALLIVRPETVIG